MSLNPQLRSLEIHFNQFILLKFFSKYLQSIENLNITVGTTKNNLSPRITAPSTYVTVEYKYFYGGKMIPFPNFTNLRINFFLYDEINLPLSLIQLKQFTLECDFEWNKSFDNFIKKHKSIENIKFETELWISPEDCLKIVKCLPSLQTMEIYQQCSLLSPQYDNILFGYFHIFTLPIFKKLRSFSMHVDSSKSSEDFIRKYCDKDWHVNYTYLNNIWSVITLKPIESTV